MNKHAESSINHSASIGRPSVAFHLEDGVDVFNALQVEADTLSDLALSALEERESKRERLLSSVIDNSLFFVTPSQKDALLRCAPEDKLELDALFSAMQNTDTSKYPVGKKLDVGQAVGYEEEVKFRFDG